MSGSKAKAARREAGEGGRDNFKETPRNPGRYLTRKERQERNRRDRAAAKRQAEMAAKLTAAFTRGREKGAEQ